MKNKVYWSKVVKLISTFSLLLIVVACVLSLWDGLSWGACITVVLLLAAILYCAYMAPNYIVVTDDAIKLHKLLGVMTIPLNEIKSISVYKAGSIDARLWGSGGVLGFTGLFFNNKIGNYHSYVGCYQQTFLIETLKGKKYLFSCENRDQLVSLIKNKIERF